MKAERSMWRTKAGPFQRAWTAAGLAILAVLAAGCGARTGSADPARSSSPAARQLSSHASGTRLTGSGIGPSRFGQPERQVLAELKAALGPPTRPYQASRDCNVDHAIAWPGLDTFFAHGSFAGYSYQRRHLQTSAGLKVGDSIEQARQLYRNALRLSLEQGGTWFARTPYGQLSGFTYGRSGNQADIGPHSRVATIEAGKVGCPALSP